MRKAYLNYLTEVQIELFRNKWVFWIGTKEMMFEHIISCFFKFIFHFMVGQANVQRKFKRRNIYEKSLDIYGLSFKCKYNAISILV